MKRMWLVRFFDYHTNEKFEVTKKRRGQVGVTSDKTYRHFRPFMYCLAMTVGLVPTFTFPPSLQNKPSYTPLLLPLHLLSLPLSFALLILFLLSYPQSSFVTSSFSLPFFSLHKWFLQFFWHFVCSSPLFLFSLSKR
jgi:hypothetical protein